MDATIAQMSMVVFGVLFLIYWRKGFFERIGPLEP